MTRTRFAPSPTGRLHLGNVRTAVFNWLFARHQGGAFILRIEDTDESRTVEGSEQWVMEDLRWLGLDWDEGPDIGGPYGPYRQSERADRYRSAADDLVQRGRAYLCFCGEGVPEDDVGTGGAGESSSEGTGGGRGRGGGSSTAEAVDRADWTRYPGTCRGLARDEVDRLLSEGRSPAVRFRVPGGEAIEIRDEIRGSITFPIKDFGDFVILRPDGRATYNFAVVVDDAEMEITRVIRGAGHLSNTPNQAMIYDAMGRERPVFAHLPTVLSPQGGKLSKREGAVGVSELREAGYSPEAIVNYLSLLGWSSADEVEVMGSDELIESISLERVGASDTTFDPEKLRWMSGQHLARRTTDELVAAVRPFLREGQALDEGAPLRAAIEALGSRLQVLSDFPRYVDDFLFPDEERLEMARGDLAADPEALALAAELASELHRLEGWEAETLGRVVRETGKRMGARGASLFHPIRKALCGSESGPDLGRMMEAIGRDEVIRRLEAVAKVE